MLVKNNASFDNIQAKLGSSFSLVSSHYAVSRPSYPTDLISKIVDEKSKVLELGAGTGLLTKVVAPRCRELVATDLSPEMLTHLRDSAPTRHIAAARAEQLPFGAKSFHQVIAGQAAHWFELKSSLAEIARVLTPNGHLILIWNKRINAEEWLDRFDRIVNSVRTDDTERNIIKNIEQSGLFSKFAKKTANFSHEISTDNAASYVESFSHVSTLPDPQRTATIAKGADCLIRNANPRGIIEIPITCEAYVAQLI